MRRGAAGTAIIVAMSILFTGCTRETHSVEQFGKDDNLRASVIADCKGGKLDDQPAECTRAQDADRLAQRLKSLGQ